MVAGRIPLVCCLFWDGYQKDFFFTGYWCVASGPALVVDMQYETLCSGAEVFHLLFHQVQLSEGQVFGHAWVKASTSCVLKHSLRLGPDIFDSVNQWRSYSLFFKNSGMAGMFTAAFPVTAPFVVCSVVLLLSELSPLSDFVSRQSFFVCVSLSIFREAVLIFEPVYSSGAFRRECLSTFCGARFL